ncbi:MAG TPA: VOC family protein [Acidobacteriaceae bacterium]|nr:VOC family protein [Acidobacteriaceae bacterium]
MLRSEQLVAFVPIREADRSRSFYRDTLGLRLLSEDRFALVFEINGVPLRATLVGEFQPQRFTVLGWQVSDAAAAARRLSAAGVHFERYSGMEQDELGLWSAPGGARVAWFRDPDGNVLSITQMPEAA